MSEGIKWKDLRDGMIWKSKKSGTEVIVRKTAIDLFLLDKQNRRRYIRLGNLNRYYEYVSG